MGMGAKSLGGGVNSHGCPEVTFDKVVSLENLVTAWYEFRRGKRSRQDIRLYEYDLEDNIFNLHKELTSEYYRPDIYHQFRINDPKPRLISKATVRDRLVHHAIYRCLYPIFDRSFIFDSYSCRLGKGSHKAFARVRRQILSCSRNYTRPCFALKCDIRRFFDTIDHEVLLGLISKRVQDEQLLDLLNKVVKGFEVQTNKGMPIGNLTSQLFANIYMDPLDKFIKHRLKSPYYVRYADDFLLLANTEVELMGHFVEIWRFLKEFLRLELHPHKISLRKLSWGIDFVGYVAVPHQALPRQKTVKRMFERMDAISNATRLSAALDSYLGYLQHADAQEIKEQLVDHATLIYTNIT